LKYVSLFLFVCILVLSCFATPAFANSIPIQNFSFETTNPLNISCGAGCAYNNGPIPGWTTTGGQQGTWQPSSAYFTSVPDGSLVAFSNGGTISQTLSDSLLANTLYTLTVAVGNRLDTVTGGFATTYIIQLFAGNTLLNSITGSNTTIPLGTFMDVSFNYLSGNTLPSGNLSIVLSSVGPQSDFDNVRLTATSAATSVSEPGSLTLLAAGLGLALFVFRRR
jgi:PEP-CTERM motif